MLMITPARRRRRLSGEGIKERLKIADQIRDGEVGQRPLEAAPRPEMPFRTTASLPRRGDVPEAISAWHRCSNRAIMPAEWSYARTRYPRHVVAARSAGAATRSRAARFLREMLRDEFNERSSAPGCRLDGGISHLTAPPTIEVAALRSKSGTGELRIRCGDPLSLGYEPWSSAPSSAICHSHSETSAARSLDHPARHTTA